MKVGNNVKLSSNYWDLNAPRAKRDLVIKKVGVSIIALLNFAALSAALYAIITYCPVSTQAWLASPFLIGVFGALAYMKFPTLGVTKGNYSQLSNPALMLGKIVTYIFFGPLTYATNRSDWTTYHDPIVAHEIGDNIKTMRFSKLADKYGTHFDNWAHYGIIAPQFKEALLALYRDYRPLKQALDFYTNKGLNSEHERIALLNGEQEQIETRWEALKEQIVPLLHFPEIPEYNFRGRFTKTRLQLADSIYENPLLTTARLPL